MLMNDKQREGKPVATPSYFVLKIRLNSAV